ncbi:unnamed protein product [Prorocentrum cordatum]|uniref:Uncharacterized protein n=1 Tax=Prorocentrum cordatum TaxID=2364126 RepID=A0ABN9UHX1_9DINO|nr:unnamed protein product [Polarella glacialis]
MLGGAAQRRAVSVVDPTALCMSWPLACLAWPPPRLRAQRGPPSAQRAGAGGEERPAPGSPRAGGPRGEPQQPEARPAPEALQLPGTPEKPPVRRRVSAELELASRGRAQRRQLAGQAGAWGTRARRSAAAWSAGRWWTGASSAGWERTSPRTTPPRGSRVASWCPWRSWAAP